MMKTEKRRANVGERILITKATEAQGNYKNGDVSTVVEIGVFGESGTVRVKEHVRPIYASEYEVIVSEPKNSARITALETQVAALEAKVEALESAQKYPLTAQFELQNAEVDAILADIERKAKPTPTANERRADVIKRAKAFVSDYRKTAGYTAAFPYAKFDYTFTKFDFIVNSEKRTVVALITPKYACNGNRVLAKGIAKCDPDDVFNADIGKAIALARALGVEVPEEFVKAVQPTEVVVGQTLQSNVFREYFYEVTRTSDDRAFLDGSSRYYLFSDYPRSYRIADDTAAVYE